MDKAIYAIGNGEVMVYGCHDEWNEVIGPVYTSGSMFSLKRTLQTEWTSERKYASSVWTHVSEFGRLTDFASREYHCLVRKYEGSKTLTFKISFFDNEAFDNSVLFGDDIQAYILRRKEGSSAYERYVSREDKYLQILLRNGAYIEGDILYLPDGGEIVTVAKDGYDSLFAHAMEIKDIDSEKILASVKNEDDELVKRRMSRLPELRDHEMKDKTLKAIDDVAMLIRAQQSVTGGVQAGHNYHLAYVRDEYGVFRGLLAMGMWEEAEAILTFYRDVFTKYGKIANAQSMGNGGIFHIHEYDGTEITGYIAYQAYQMLKVTGNTELFKSLIPLIKWVTEEQMPLLHNGMLPFNGDETYIAGYILPRDCINTGALEATYLFVRGVETSLPEVEKLIGRQDWTDAAYAKAQEVRSLYESNFRRENGYVCNSLKRLEGLDAPKVRRAICNKCGRFGWNHRISDNWYVCDKCLPTAGDESDVKEYFIKSVITMAVYTGSDMLDESFLKNEIAGFFDGYRKSGILPSRPDGSKCIGYDYGLMLYAAKHFGMDADDLLKKMLEIRDSAGAWVEYYENHVPVGTFCRPWESAINIEGAIEYLRK